MFFNTIFLFLNELTQLKWPLLLNEHIDALDLCETLNVLFGSIGPLQTLKTFNFTSA